MEINCSFNNLQSITFLLQYVSQCVCVGVPWPCHPGHQCQRRSYWQSLRWQTTLSWKPPGTWPPAGVSLSGSFPPAALAASSVVRNRGLYIYILKASWLWQQKCKCYFITKQKHIVHCVRVLPTSRAKKAWTLLVLSKQSRQLVLMVPPWVLKKHIIVLRSNKKNVIVFNTFVEVLTLWFPSLLCSRRSRTLLWTCWGKVWGHCAVCLPCLPSHFDGSQSSPSSLLLHALRPSGDSENNREEEDIQTQCENDAHAKCVPHPQRNISLHSLMQNQQTVFQRNLWRALLIAASLHQYKKRLTFKFCRTYFVSIINK